MRFASERTGRTLALVGLLAGLAAGCTAPQSGVFQSHWCHPAPTEGLPTVMLDDMEDGDSVPCLGTGRWMVEGTGDFAPDPTGAAAVPTELSDDDQAVRAPSTRALHLSGTLPAGGWGGLIMPLAQPDLTGFQEVDFWAKSVSAASALIRVGVFTAAGDYFSRDVSIRSTWGDSGSDNNAALKALIGSDSTPISTDQLASCVAIDFQFISAENAGAPSVDFWVDDVQLKRTASQ